MRMALHESVSPTFKESVVLLSWDPAASSAAQSEHFEDRKKIDIVGKTHGRYQKALHRRRHHEARQSSSMVLIIRQKEPTNLETPFDQVDTFLTSTELFYIRSHSRPRS